MFRWTLLLTLFCTLLFSVAQVSVAQVSVAQARTEAVQVAMQNYVQACAEAVSTLLLDQPTGRPEPGLRLTSCQDKRLHLERFRPVEALGRSQIVPRPDLATGVLITFTDAQLYTIQWPQDAQAPPTPMEQLSSASADRWPSWLVLLLLSSGAAQLVWRLANHLFFVRAGWLSLLVWAGLILLTFGMAAGGADFGLPGAGWSLAILNLPLASVALALLRKWLWLRAQRFTHALGITALSVSLLCTVFTLLSSPLGLQAEALWLGFPMLLLWLLILSVWPRLWQRLSRAS